MPNRKITGLPILGIAHEEERLDDSVVLSTKYQGPCRACGKVRWLDHRPARGWICEECAAGPDWEADPIVDDIRQHLATVHQEVTDLLLETTEDLEPPAYHAITADVHEGVNELVCPECEDHADTLVYLLSQWICETCIHQATGGQIVGRSA